MAAAAAASVDLQGQYRALLDNPPQNL